MQGREATERFEESKRLYAAGRYTDALRLLDALDEEFPYQKNVVYPKALCLAKLGRVEEALTLCDWLVAEFHDPRAEALRAELRKPPIAQQPAAPLFQPIQLDDLAPPPTYKPVAPEKSSLWRDILVYGGVALITLVVVMVVVGVVANMASQSAQETAASAPEQMPGQGYEGYGPRYTENFTPFQALVMLLSFLTNGLPLYITLFMINKLPYGEFWKDLLHTWFIGTLVGIAMQVCCCIMVPLGIVFVKRSYDLEVGEVFIWIFVSLVVGIMQALAYVAAGILIF